MSIWLEPTVTFDEFADRYDELVELEEAGKISPDDHEHWELENMREVYNNIGGDKTRPYGGTFYSPTAFVDYIAETIQENYIPRGDWSEWPWRHIDVRAAAREAADDYTEYDMLRTPVGKRTYIWVPN